MAQESASTLGLRGGLAPQAGLGSQMAAATGAPFAAASPRLPPGAAPPVATPMAATSTPAPAMATGTTTTALPPGMQPGLMPLRGDALAASARQAGDAALAAGDRAATAATLAAASSASGNTAATAATAAHAAAASAAGATLAANPLAPTVLPLADARGNPMLAGNDARPGQIGRADGATAQGHTVTGPGRPGDDTARRDRRGGWNGLLATLGAGSAAAREELADLREAELAYQWLYWVLTLAAYGALGLLLASAFVWLGAPRMPTGLLGQPSTMGWLVAIGLGCAVGAWRLATHRDSRRDRTDVSS